MATTEETLQILKMIESHKITAEEGRKLLEVLRRHREAAEPARWLRVRVTDRRTGRQTINVNLPMQLVDLGLRVGARFAPEIEELDWEELRDTLKSGLRGRVLELREGDEYIEIFLE